MNEVIKTIYERRAVRKYLDKVIDKKSIEEILDAGRMAPSAINKQSWKFYVLTDKKKILEFSSEIKKEAAKDFLKMGIKKIIKTATGFLHVSHGTDFLKEADPVFHGAPVVIFVAAPRDNEWAGLDLGMCCQNMMLAARSLGFDTCPVGFAKYVEKTKNYPDLKIPAEEQVHLAVILGYGNEKPEAKERKKDNVVFL